MERKLASIQVVRKLLPIKGADFIEVAIINDWSVIVKKGEFQVNSKCVYFEIDSLLPEEPQYEFLSSSKRDYFGVPKYRIKTMKMRGVISQGLALPLTLFTEVSQDIQIGHDLTELLRIEKYDPEFYTDNGNKPKNGNPLSRFPSFIPKTDQERIQNLPHYYETYKDHEWEETLKLDGSSLTAYKIHKPLSLFKKIKQFFGFKQKDYHFGVCSRNIELKRSESSDFWKIMIELDVERYLPEGYAIQGELIGPHIQSNHEKVSQNEFYLFDIYDINNNRYLMPEERKMIMKQLPTIKHVPIVNKKSKIFDRCTDLQLLQQQVSGSSINYNTISEGRVYKSCTIAGLSFKCINNEYLLKSEK